MYEDEILEVSLVLCVSMDLPSLSDMFNFGMQGLTIEQFRSVEISHKEVEKSSSNMIHNLYQVYKRRKATIALTTKYINITNNNINIDK